MTCEPVSDCWYCDGAGIVQDHYRPWDPIPPINKCPACFGSGLAVDPEMMAREVHDVG